MFRKSNKQRRAEIKRRRLDNAKSNLGIDTSIELKQLPEGAVKSDLERLTHNNTYDLLPRYYVDIPFVCRDCGAEEVFTAKQQKWWYEIKQANINSGAVRCYACRKRIRDEKVAQKKHMEDLAKRAPHPNEAFFKRK
jgi:hypothetical protein